MNRRRNPIITALAAVFAALTVVAGTAPPDRAPVELRHDQFRPEERDAMDDLRQAYLFREQTGLTPDMETVGSVFLDLAGYATAHGLTIEDARAQFGYAGSSTVIIPSGNVDCTVDAKGPHKGTVDLGGGVKHQWVKAKAYARCEYRHTAPGRHPPSMSWTLRMLLVRDPAPWKWWGAYAAYPKTGFAPVWRENQGRRGGTQVWFTYCENDDYENRVACGCTRRSPSSTSD